LGFLYWAKKIKPYPIFLKEKGGIKLRGIKGRSFDIMRTWEKLKDGTSRSKHVVTASELELLSQHKQQPQQQQGGYHQPQGGYYQHKGVIITR